MHKPGLNDIKLFLFVQVPAKSYTLLNVLEEAVWPSGLLVN